MRIRLHTGALPLFITLGLIGYGGYQLVFVEPGAPVYLPAALRYTTACVTPDAPISQSFRVDARALRALTLYPASPGSTVRASGHLLVELRDKDSTLQQLSIDAARLAVRDAFTFELPRPEPAAGRTFTLSIARMASAAGCVAFQASGVNMPDGQLTIGERVQWGDLLFRAHADRGTVLHLSQRWLADRIGVQIPLVLLGALAVVYALGLAWLCRTLIVSAPAAGASHRA